MEFAIKLGWTLVAAVMVWGLSAFTIKVWRSHVDPTATFNRIIAKFQKEPTDVIATREDDAFYQDGEMVGRVTGKIVETRDSFLFEEVADTSKLKQDQDIEFRRMRIRVESIESFLGTKFSAVITATGRSSSVRSAVITNVKCRIVSKK